MGKSRDEYEVNFKKSIVKLYESGESVASLKIKYSITDSLIYKWINLYSIKPNPKLKIDDGNIYSADDIKNMEAKIKDLEEDNEILKKAMTIFEKNKKL